MVSSIPIELKKKKKKKSMLNLIGEEGGGQEILSFGSKAFLYNKKINY